ncbi:MAG: tetratricopeptide repeat protein [candidate division Zixibacteria bacterium]|nr:tetratricopeptide repeat protein [candidate division Zixibacteria bacterium]
MIKKTTIMILLVFSAGIVFGASSSKLVKDVVKMLEAGNIAQAESVIDSALAVSPEDHRLLIAKGNILDIKEDYTGALNYFEQALVQKSKDSDALYGAGMAALKTDQAEKALEYFERGIDRGKRKGDFLYGKALAQKELGLLADADATIRKAISKDKENVTLIRALGDINYAKEVWSIALTQYNKVLEKDPSQTDLFYKIARANFYSKQFTESVKYYKEYLKLHESDIEAWHELATICTHANLPAEAIYCFTKLTELKPENGNNWYTLGDLQFGIRDYEASGVSLEKTLEFSAAIGDSLVAESYKKLAKIYNVNKKYFKADSAYTRFEQALGAPEDPVYWFEKGKVMIKIGQKDVAFFDRAIESFGKAIELDSTDAYHWEYAALSRYYKQDYSGAIPFFLNRIEIGGENVNSLRNLAFCYIKTEKYELAASTLEKAIVLKPEDAIMRQMIGRIYGFLGSGTEEKANKHLPNSIKHYKVALKDTTGALSSADICKMKGNIGMYYVTLRDPKNAQTYLLKAVKCSPKDIDYLYNLAMAYFLDNDCDNTLEYSGQVRDLTEDEHKPARELYFRCKKR